MDEKKWKVKDDVGWMLWIRKNGKSRPVNPKETRWRMKNNSQMMVILEDKTEGLSGEGRDAEEAWEVNRELGGKIEEGAITQGKEGESF